MYLFLFLSSIILHPSFHPHRSSITHPSLHYFSFHIVSFSNFTLRVRPLSKIFHHGFRAIEMNYQSRKGQRFSRRVWSISKPTFILHPPFYGWQKSLWKQFDSNIYCSFDLPSSIIRLRIIVPRISLSRKSWIFFFHWGEAHLKFDFIEVESIILNISWKFYKKKEKEGGGELEIGTNQRFIDSKLPFIIKKKRNIEKHVSGGDVWIFPIWNFFVFLYIYSYISPFW